MLTLDRSTQGSDEPPNQFTSKWQGSPVDTPRHDFAAVRFCWYAVTYEARAARARASKGWHKDKGQVVASLLRHAAFWRACIDRRALVLRDRKADARGGRHRGWNVLAKPCESV